MAVSKRSPSVLPGFPGELAPEIEKRILKHWKSEGEFQRGLLTHFRKGLADQCIQDIWKRIRSWISARPLRLKDVAEEVALPSSSVTREELSLGSLIAILLRLERSWSNLPPLPLRSTLALYGYIAAINYVHERLTTNGPTHGKSLDPVGFVCLLHLMREEKWFRARPSRSPQDVGQLQAIAEDLRRQVIEFLPHDQQSLGGLSRDRLVAHFDNLQKDWGEAWILTFEHLKDFLWEVECDSFQQNDPRFTGG